ncbi:hypothetical protein EIP86_010668 [Pleurotus ostreatoroseus]|nr:hypothetical protein EIP86_010668 [Pleurotus ostreatoroseus]
MAALSRIPDLFAVKGMIAVVTGGGTGIGLMMAKALEHNGAVVYIVSRRLDTLRRAAQEHNRYGNLIPVECDITSTESVRRLVDRVKKEHGLVNLLVNNAGVSTNMLGRIPTPRDTADIRHLQRALLPGSRADFGAAFEINTTAAYYTTIHFLELLNEGNRRGNTPGVTSQVITVASGGGFRKDDKVFSVSYTLSKTAAIHLGKMLAHFLKDWKIRSNVVCPGIFPSEMTEGLFTTEKLKAAVPLQREGTLDDMAGLTLFLASRAGAYVNGAVQLIDGGRLTLFPSSY